VSETVKVSSDQGCKSTHPTVMVKNSRQGEMKNDSTQPHGGSCKKYSGPEKESHLTDIPRSLKKEEETK